MHVRLGKKRVVLRERDLLGSGGEARVYRHDDLALKVFHPIPANDVLAARVRDQKIAKIAALARLAPLLPAAVVAPVDLLTDDAGAAIGLAMPLVEGADTMARIGQRKWRDASLDAAGLLALLRDLAAILTAVHRTGAVVGDLNDGNVLLTAGGPRLIDVDSFQLAGLPCPVAHERFLDPRLYGVDLAASPVFAPEHDFYSLAVMLVVGLLYVHPYGGVHKGFTTFLRRGEARHSIFRGDVALPKSAAPLEALPDAALHCLAKIFDHDARGALPAALFTTRFTRCAGCGLEHARAACPACRVVAPVPAPLRTVGGVTVRRVFETDGEILAAAMQRGRLVVAVRTKTGAIERENGAVVAARVEPHARVVLSGERTHVVTPRSDGLAEIVTSRPGAVAERCLTGAVAGAPAFAASADTFVRTEDEWLFAGDMRLGKILEGETTLAMGERFGVGLYRAGAIVVAFAFNPARPGLRTLAVPGLSALGAARIERVAARFDDRHVLLVVDFVIAGRPRVLVALVDADGRVLAEATGAPEDGPLFGPAHGKALMGGAFVCASDDGLVVVRAENGRFVPGAVFADTAPFVTAADELLVGPGGAVLVVRARTIHELRRDAS